MGRPPRGRGACRPRLRREEREFFLKKKGSGVFDGFFLLLSRSAFPSGRDLIFSLSRSLSLKRNTQWNTKLTDDVRVGRVLEPEVECVGQGAPRARRAKGRAEEDAIGVFLGDELAVLFRFCILHKTNQRIGRRRKRAERERSRSVKRPNENHGRSEGEKKAQNTYRVLTNLDLNSTFPPSSENPNLQT